MIKKMRNSQKEEKQNSKKQRNPENDRINLSK